MNSMTGYARVEKSMLDIQITIEMKSVNHRFFDGQFKMPKELNALEIEMKRLLKASCTRGRIECVININKEHTKGKSLTINQQALESLACELEVIKEDHPHLSLSVSSFLTGGVMHPGLVEAIDPKIDEDVLWHVTMEAFKECTELLEKSRKKEGQALGVIFLNQLDIIQDKTSDIIDCTKEFQDQHATRLSKKMLELFDGHQIDEQRILTEVALLVERGDITEELDRLNVHILNMRELLNKTGPVGKEMDFIIQEMNREVNTIGSKSSVMTIKEVVVSLKLCIEQMREQVQNIE